VLLEKIANQPQEKSISTTSANNIKNDITNKTKELDSTI
jgi:hypothetical protein